MATHGRGLICLTLTAERCDALRLPLISPQNTSTFGTAFCESIDAREGVTTGISAADRTRTILTAIDPKCKPQDLARPGHVFPLRAREGGVLVRAGQTEAACDLARLAGLEPAGVICEIMNEDGTMARVPQLDRILRAARFQDGVGGRSHPLPAEDRTLHPSRRGRLHRDRFRIIPYDRLRERVESRNTTWRWSAARSPGARACWCGCIRAALYGDVFGCTQCDCERSAARLLAYDRRGRRRACWSICTKRDRDSAWSDERRR